MLCATPFGYKASILLLPLALLFLSPDEQYDLVIRTQLTHDKDRQVEHSGSEPDGREPMWTSDLVKLRHRIITTSGLNLITRSRLGQRYLATRKILSAFANHPLTSRQRYATPGYSNYPIDYSNSESHLSCPRTIPSIFQRRSLSRYPNFLRFPSQLRPSNACLGCISVCFRSGLLPFLPPQFLGSTYSVMLPRYFEARYMMGPSSSM